MCKKKTNYLALTSTDRVKPLEVRGGRVRRRDAPAADE